MLKILPAGVTGAVLLMLFAGSGFAQTSRTASNNAAGQVWQIPYASTGNTISLSIQNNSTLEAKNVSVTFNNPPSWLEFKSDKFVLKSIPANSSSDAEFTFSAEKVKGQNSKVKTTTQN